MCDDLLFVSREKKGFTQGCVNVNRDCGFLASFLACLWRALGATMRVPAVLSRRSALGAALSTFAALGPNAPAYSISATTMTGKSKANLGVVLVEAPKQVGNKMSADVVLDGGVIATATMDTPWTLADGGYADFEASTREGEAAYLQVEALGEGQRFDTVPKSWFGDALFKVQH